jgi:hypothetical protein
VEVRTAVAFGDSLWLAVEAGVSAPPGLYRLELDSDVARLVVPVDQGVFTLAADPWRGRLLATGLDGRALFTIDPVSGRPTEHPGVDLGKTSIAVTSDSLWLGGFATGSPRVVRLDPQTLRLQGASPVSDQVGPGAIVWPGSAVVWVRTPRVRG